MFDKPARATRHATKLQRFRDKYMSFARRIGSGLTRPLQKYCRLAESERASRDEKTALRRTKVRIEPKDIPQPTGAPARPVSEEQSKFKPGFIFGYRILITEQKRGKSSQLACENLVTILLDAMSGGQLQRSYGLDVFKVPPQHCAVRRARQARSRARSFIHQSSMPGNIVPSNYSVLRSG